MKIKGWRAFQTEFVDCVFTGELRGCWFTGTTERAQYPSHETNEFRGNDFSGATLIQCEFDYGIDVTAQRWPRGPEYVLLDQLHERVRAARAAVARWPDETAREAALATLLIMSDRGMAQQEAAFLRREDWLKWLPEARDELFQLLEAAPEG